MEGPNFNDMEPSSLQLLMRRSVMTCDDLCCAEPDTRLCLRLRLSTQTQLQPPESER